MYNIWAFGVIILYYNLSKDANPTRPSARGKVIKVRGVVSNNPVIPLTQGLPPNENQFIHMPSDVSAVHFCWFAPACDFRCYACITRNNLTYKLVRYTHVMTCWHVRMWCSHTRRFDTLRCTSYGCRNSFKARAVKLLILRIVLQAKHELWLKKIVVNNSDYDTIERVFIDKISFREFVCSALRICRMWFFVFFFCFFTRETDNSFYTSIHVYAVNILIIIIMIIMISSSGVIRMWGRLGGHFSPSSLTQQAGVEPVTGRRHDSR